VAFISGMNSGFTASRFAKGGPTRLADVSDARGLSWGKKAPRRSIAPPASHDRTSEKG
jgi:hypothetical protein